MLGPQNGINMERNELALLRLYQAFPWYGTIAMTIQNKRYLIWLPISFIMLLTVFYCIYITSIFIWELLLFPFSFAEGIPESIFGFVSFLEFYALILMRTRSSLLFLPRFSYALLFALFFIFANNFYTFYALASQSFMAFIFAGCCFCLFKFEIPSRSWNQSYFYTPSENCPRTMFFPAYSYYWKNEVPPIWTMFFPLAGRDEFSEQELSLVSGNLPLLTSYIGNNQGNQEQIEVPEPLENDFVQVGPPVQPFEMEEGPRNQRNQEGNEEWHGVPVRFDSPERSLRTGESYNGIYDEENN